MTVIPIVIGALATFAKGLVEEMEELEIGEGIKTIHTTAQLRSARRVLTTWGDFLSPVKNY